MKFSLIGADPPWEYRVWSTKGKGRSAEQHYGVMTLDDIKALPVHQIAADDSACLLWVTNPCLEQGLETLEAWGFDYKTVAFTWVKRNKIADSWFWGLGHYTRQNPEQVLLGTRGKGLQRVSRSVHSVIDARIMRHSQKPAEWRDRAVQLFGDVSRIELFARDRALGWSATGLECDGRDIRDAIGYYAGLESV